MNRWRYRWILPNVQTVLYVFLIVTSCPYLEMARQRNISRPVEAPSSAERGFDIRCFWHTTPIEERIATGLNLPPYVVGILLAAPLMQDARLECDEAEYAMHIAGGLFIPFFWFLVGRAIDNRHHRRPRPSRAKWVMAILAASVLTLVGVTLAVLAVLNSPSEYIINVVFILTWIGAGIYALARSMSGWRRVSACPAV